MRIHLYPLIMALMQVVSPVVRRQAMMYLSARSDLPLIVVRWLVLYGDIHVVRNVIRNNNDLSFLLASLQLREAGTEPQSSHRGLSHIETFTGEGFDGKFLQRLPVLLRRSIAVHPNLDAATRQMLLCDPSSAVRAAIAGIPHLSSLALHLLSTDFSPLVRQTVARHPLLSHEMIGRLAHDPCDEVRAVIATRPCLQRDILWQLAHDPAACVRAAVATRADISIEHIDALVRDSTTDVRVALCSSPALTSIYIDRLSRDPSPRVRRELVCHQHLQPYHISALACDTHFTVRAAIASYPSLHERWLAFFAMDDSFYVREALARRGDLPYYLIRRLSCDESEIVRAAIAANPRTHIRILRKLLHDPSPVVRQALAIRSDLPSSFLDYLLKDNNPGVRRRLAERHALSRQVMRRLMVGAGTENLCCIAFNPRIPHSNLFDLWCEDPISWTDILLLSLCLRAEFARCGATYPNPDSLHLLSRWILWACSNSSNNGASEICPDIQGFYHLPPAWRSAVYAAFLAAAHYVDFEKSAIFAGPLRFPVLSYFDSQCFIGPNN